ncbi:MAG: nucleoside deaminase [Planctomycetaceae bacterium]
MRLAIEKSREGIAQGQTPFGCAIARDGEVLAVAHNTVLRTLDITAHAEINAIRGACRQVGGIFLERAVVASTCEPCPMCLAALHWARVDVVYFGAGIADARSAGFNELQISAGEMCRHGRSPIRLVPGLMQEDCRRLFDEWKSHPAARAY